MILIFGKTVLFIKVKDNILNFKWLEEKIQNKYSKKIQDLQVINSFYF